MLPEAVRQCREQFLIIRIRTEGAVPDVRSMTYPVYCAGITRPGDSVIEGRNLGIAFNAVANRLIP